MTFGKSREKIKVMVKFNEDATRVARFFAVSVFANLYCFMYSDDSISTLGVRFVRKIKKSKK